MNHPENDNLLILSAETVSQEPLLHEGRIEERATNKTEEKGIEVCETVNQKNNRILP